MAHFMVERYLPGMSEEALRAELARLATATAGTAVRYVGSTILLEDEACFCHFEASSVAAVAEVNGRAGVPVDRIIAALPVVPPPS
jgi:Nickel responsive protein SCO4226-like